MMDTKHLLGFALLVVAIGQAEGRTYGFYCSVNTMTKCQALLNSSGLQPYYKDLDSLGRLFPLFRNLTHTNMTICQNQTVLDNILKCVVPGLGACKPQKVQKLSIIPNVTALIQAVTTICNYRGPSCTFPNGTNNVISNQTIMSVQKCLIMADKPSNFVFGPSAPARQIVQTYCKVYNDLSTCIKPFFTFCNSSVVGLFQTVVTAEKPMACSMPLPPPSSASLIDSYFVLIFAMFIIIKGIL